MDRTGLKIEEVKKKIRDLGEITHENELTYRALLEWQKFWEEEKEKKKNEVCHPKRK